MNEPNFSVIVPGYNASRTIGSTIRSVLQQTDGDFELIVIDDGSTDDTVEQVRRGAAGDPRLNLVQQANQGTAATRNTGIDLARGRFLCLLDNDDLWLPTFLEAVRVAFEKAPDAGLAYTDVWILDDASKRIRREPGLRSYGYLPAAMSGEQLRRALLRINFITASTVTLRRAAIERVGAFDTTVQGSDDYDLWLRLAAAGYGAVRPPGCLALLRDRPGSQSKDRLMMARNLHRVLNRAAAELHDSPADRETVDKRLDALTRTIRGFDGERDAASTLFRLRHRLGGAKARLKRPLDLRRRPPAEILAAFPEIEAL